MFRMLLDAFRWLCGKERVPLEAPDSVPDYATYFNSLGYLSVTWDKLKGWYWVLPVDAAVGLEGLRVRYGHPETMRTATLGRPNSMKTMFIFAFAEGYGPTERQAEAAEEWWSRWKPSVKGPYKGDAPRIV